MPSPDSLAVGPTDGTTAGSTAAARLAYEQDTALEAGAEFLRLTADYLAATRAGEGPVSTGLDSAALDARFDEPLPREGRPLEEIAARLARDVVADANRLMHPMYLGHQVSAPLPAAVWAEPLVAALNQSLAVREMSPTATAVEQRLVRWMCELLGYGPAAGGTLTSGGTEATFTALLAARAAALPDAWEQGVGPNPPVVVCGEHAHYAVTRAVAELGLGTRRAIAVPSREWRMDTDALRATLDDLARAGTPVMAVVATAGSTATGAFDDLETIGRLCDARGLWLHVDGAHGASALLSETQRDRLRGIERARSVAWDAHKMMLLPLSAGMLLVRDERDLDAAFAQRAPYLFHAGPAGRVVDQGVRSFLCSRRADVLKVWVALQRYGADGIGALYDYLCGLAATLHARLEARADFEAIHAPASNILCFRWRGPHAPDDPRLDALNLALRERYNRSGAGWITTTLLGGRRVLRVTIMNPRTTPAHLDRLLDGLSAEGRALLSEGGGVT
ncbi:MAG TPA: pyridoxal-dependent decarboxylase [Gemmatimonadales bacterium]|nr:pyridoxal-dependent decarboxylase [Gemmatimonadales bacterium]